MFPEEKDTSQQSPGLDQQQKRSRCHGSSYWRGEDYATGTRLLRWSRNNCLHFIDFRIPRQAFRADKGLIIWTQLSLEKTHRSEWARYMDDSMWPRDSEVQHRRVQKRLTSANRTITTTATPMRRLMRSVNANTTGSSSSCPREASNQMRLSHRIINGATSHKRSGCA